MSTFDTFNFLEIQNAKDADRALQKLGDLKDEAEYLQKQGVPVKSWYEFKRQEPVEEPQYARNIAVGAGIGAVLMGGLAVALAPAALGIGAAAYALGTGALFGGMLGGYHETENSQRRNLVEKYEDYIGAVQAHAPTSPSLKPEQAHQPASPSYRCHKRPHSYHF